MEAGAGCNGVSGHQLSAWKFGKCAPPGASSFILVGLLQQSTVGWGKPHRLGANPTGWEQTPQAGGKSHRLVGRIPQVGGLCTARIDLSWLWGWKSQVRWVGVWRGLLLMDDVSSLCPHVDEGLGALWGLPTRALIHPGGCTL